MALRAPLAFTLRAVSIAAAATAFALSLALIAGAWLLQEPLNWVDFIGIVPVVLGIVMVTRAR